MRERLKKIVEYMDGVCPSGLSCYECKHKDAGAGCSVLAKVDYLIASDVVPVVRCKDCKHCTVTSDGMVCECALPTKRMQDYYIYGSTILAKVEPGAFCSYGERREGE